MSRRARRRWSVLYGCCLAGLAPRALSAQGSADANACADAFEQAQELRLGGKLGAAAERARACAVAGCPEILAARCEELARDIQQSEPSIIVAAFGPNGAELVDVQVWIDGERRAQRLEGRPIALDPGARRLRLEAVGLEPVELTLVVREGEKHRIIHAEFKSAAAPRAAEAPARQPARKLTPPHAPRQVPAPATPAASSPFSTPVLVALAVAGAGLALGATWGGMALATKKDLDESCPAPDDCPADRADDIRAMQRNANLATAGFAVAGAGLVTAALCFRF